MADLPADPVPATDAHAIGEARADKETNAGPPATAPIASSLPSRGARGLAMAAIVVAGICGGLIGWKVTNLSISGDAGVWPGVGGLVGAAFGAGGVAVVSVLVLRAMTEWAVIVETGDPTAGRRNRRPS